MSALQETALQREQMIAEAAYFRAERRGFEGGDPLIDWLEAEAEIEARFAGPEKPEEAGVKPKRAQRKKPARRKAKTAARKPRSG
ncbi:MAG TPA: DUF2934 domain-containing protein [Woeseiaceae bacterium]|nr:DUF2934 domain-containing protein [Woeseiaceae bacterium]